MRTWRPPALQFDIVGPKVYRPEIVSLGHETHLPGHMGVNKKIKKTECVFSFVGQICGRMDLIFADNVTLVKWKGSQIKPFLKRNYSQSQQSESPSAHYS